MEDYIKQVSARLPPCDSIHDPEIFIRQLHREGFSVDDAVAYLRCMEEYNPSLDEDIALARMAKIQAKYEKKT